MKTISSKTISSMIIALFLVSTVALTGLAGEQKAKAKKAGQSNAQPGGPGNPNPQEPNDPDSGYVYVPLQCNCSFQTKQKPAQLGQPSTFTFHGEVVNKTGQVIPKGARIEYSYSVGGVAGYFKTAQSGYLLLPAALSVNDDWFLGSAVFVTTKEPLNMSCKAYYKKKK